ncbi:MAG: methylenetetrahydrofolate--tRNA-(uracil(54)-C(5))-methyltransferase (FADH(2)-oxidizing) TrmFO [Phascolarctobacterium sp.]|nr:methylenetetrahydrofolate--tRNA-(uracil(54)-C(5))-methyltransferase (FADH(2)-oxidizing) TrmFO [Candidatus Phascolarctobacterium caballi]
MNKVHVIGAGLAGCEATWQLVSRGVPVILHEMRPVKKSPAHKTADFAELVCSNSLRAANIDNAVGLLKEEMRHLNSLIMSAADMNRVPAGGALAVDREKFAVTVTDKIKNNPLVEFVNEEVTDLDNLDGIVVIASGPLTSEALSGAAQKLVQQEYLHFFDAAAPIVTSDSLDYSKIFKASRYGKGDADYLNCPFYTKEEYIAFRDALISAEKAELHDFDKKIFFEACMPIEEMAARGEDTMRFGPLKPVGLVDPQTGKEAYAVVQLRQDNAAASLYNIVGFQTHLKWSEQKRVFGMIPGLAKAEFVRYGVMHKNTYINSPKLLNHRFNLRTNKKFYFAGQMTGVEGYVESAASGLMAGIHAARQVLGQEAVEFPAATAHGALCHYISDEKVVDFQPMNINFGLFPQLPKTRIKKREKNMLLAEKALGELQIMIKEKEI